jgi:putative transposase
MAQWAVRAGITSVVYACMTFEVSQTCYRYQANASQDYAIIADWLRRLTSAYCDWGFALCSCTCVTLRTSLGTTSACIGSIAIWG